MDDVESRDLTEPVDSARGISEQSAVGFVCLREGGRRKLSFEAEGGVVITDDVSGGPCRGDCTTFASALDR